MCIMLYLHCKNIRPYGNPHFFKVRNFHLPWFYIQFDVVPTEV
jgi:hypothetical protein